VIPTGDGIFINITFLLKYVSNLKIQIKDYEIDFAVSQQSIQH